MLLVDLEGPIGPATAEHVGRALAEAADRRAEAVVLRIDTPGGLDTATRAIIQDILGSPIPVIGHIAPRGARAASAGTFVVYATHVAAMAPATTIGAATPVQMSGPFGGSDGDDASQEAMERKVVSDARAYLRALARLRDRNAEFAERAVVEAATLDAEEALASGVVEIVATDTDALLSGLDGRAVEVLGERVVLETAGASVTRFEPTWRSRVLSVIANPNVAYVLLMLGFFGLVFELVNPGFVAPGLLGAICLVLAFFGLHVLPVSATGLVLLVLGVGLMIAEAFVPGIGILGASGLIAFVIGSIFLIDTGVLAFRVSIGLVVGVAVVSAAFFVGVLRMAIAARKREVVSGREAMIGSEAVALSSFDGTGEVRAHGEVWRATTRTPVREGQVVRIRDVRGLTLEVEP